jgi:type I restriction enzyme, S subunit
MMKIYRFKNLDRWDKFTIPLIQFRSQISSARIGDLLRPRNENVARSTHQFADVQPITIHFNGDISRRQIKNGRDYSMALKWVRPLDLVLSKIDLKNGAVGVLPVDWSNAVVTNHFAVYEPDIARVEPRYLRYLVQTTEFKKWLWANRSGADGRTEVKLPVFENVEIPLPDKLDQIAIVDAYEAALADAAAKEKAADAAETKAMADFEAALGFAPPVPLSDRPLFIASFKHMDRWSHDAVLRRVTDGGVATTSWPIVRLGQVVDDIAVGWSPKCLERAAEQGEWGVLKLSAITSGRFRPGQNKALPTSMTPRPELEVKAGDVLIARGSGVTRLVGSTTLVDNAPPVRLLICDLIFRVALNKQSNVCPAYFTEVLRTSDLRRQIEERRTGAAPMMQKITKSGLNSLTFPLPPPQDQRTLIAALDGGRAQVAALRAEAVATRSAAWKAFENAVYAVDRATTSFEFVTTKPASWAAR